LKASQRQLADFKSLPELSRWFTKDFQIQKLSALNGKKFMNSI
jgi:hypothetical protein